MDLDALTPAQRRARTELLDLGGERPSFPADLAAVLRDGLEDGIAPLIMIATVLAVRYNLRSFSIAGRSVPGFFRLELYGFLVGVVGLTLVAVVGGSKAMSLRFRDAEPDADAGAAT